MWLLETKTHRDVYPSITNNSKENDEGLAFSNGLFLSLIDCQGQILIMVLEYILGHQRDIETLNFVLFQVILRLTIKRVYPIFCLAEFPPLV